MRQGTTIRVGDSYRCMSRLNWFAGRNDVAEQQAVLAVETLSGVDSIELAMAYSNVAQLRMLVRRPGWNPDLERPDPGRPRALPQDLRRTEVTVHALNNLGTAELDLGEADDRSADAHQQPGAGARRLTCTSTLPGPTRNLASSAVVQRRHADAETWLAAGLEYCI